MQRSLVPATRSGKVIAVLVLWYVLVLAVWGIQPLTDHVPVTCVEAEGEGEDRGLTDGCRVDHLGERHDDPRTPTASQSASCHSPLSNDLSPRGDGLPPAAPGWAYEREACRIPVRSATQLLGFNTVVVAGGCALAFYWQRARRGQNVSR